MIEGEPTPWMRDTDEEEEISPAEIGLKKRCRDPEHIGERLLPLRMFDKAGKVPSTGESKHADGRYYRQAKCKVCKGRENKTFAKTYERNNRDKDRAQKMTRARRTAYRRLAAASPELFKMLYAEELRKEGITTAKYVKPSARPRRTPKD